MKRCSACEEKKGPGDFYLDKGKPRANCKDCHKRKIYDRRDEDREGFREYQREWNRKNPGKHAEYEARRRAREGDAINARRRELREEKSEQYRRQKREWWAKNRARIGEHRRMRYQENPAPVLDRNARGRARRSGAKVVLRVDEDEVIRRDCGRCGICGEPVMGPFHLDHIVPLAAGGTHEPDNVQLAHPTCNARKQDRLNFSLTAN